MQSYESKTVLGRDYKNGVKSFSLRKGCFLWMWTFHILRGQMVLKQDKDSDFQGWPSRAAAALSVMCTWKATYYPALYVFALSIKSVWTHSFIWNWGGNQKTASSQTPLNFVFLPQNIQFPARDLSFCLSFSKHFNLIFAIISYGEVDET